MLLYLLRMLINLVLMLTQNVFMILLDLWEPLIMQILLKTLLSNSFVELNLNLIHQVLLGHDFLVALA